MIKFIMQGKKLYMLGGQNCVKNNIVFKPRGTDGRNMKINGIESKGVANIEHHIIIFTFTQL